MDPWILIIQFFPEDSVLTKYIPLFKGWKSRGENVARKIERSQLKSDGISEPAPVCETGAEADPKGTTAGCRLGLGSLQEVQSWEDGRLLVWLAPHELFQRSGEVRKVQMWWLHWNCAHGHTDLMLCPHCVQHFHCTMDTNPLEFSSLRSAELFVTYIQVHSSFPIHLIMYLVLMQASVPWESMGLKAMLELKRVFKEFVGVTSRITFSSGSWWI